MPAIVVIVGREDYSISDIGFIVPPHLCWQYLFKHELPNWLLGEIS